MLNNLVQLADLAETAARAAGECILNFYRKDTIIEYKKNGSPLTLADKAAHNLINEILIPSCLPIVSEEGDELNLMSDCYWLVDPLDGTKDFLAGNDEFTVNIALIFKSRPVLGVVYAPALGDMYAGIPSQCAWIKLKGTSTAIIVQTPKIDSLKMAKSRFHDHEDADFFAQENRIEIQVPIGSSLKYAHLALGLVDVYPRLVGTSEWDTAAGQALLEAAGGCLLDWHTGKPLSYGKAGRRNPRFLALRAPYKFEDFKLKNYQQELL